MKLWPRSLFGRLALLLFGVLAIAVVVTILLFRQDRAALLARHFGDTKIVQLQALRASLAAAQNDERRETLRRIGREYGVRIVPEDSGPNVGGLPSGPMLGELEHRLRGTLGEDTEVRIQPRLRLLWIRIAANDARYWVGFPLPPRPEAEDIPSRAAIWSVTLATFLLLAAFLFARYLARPLRELDSAVRAVGQGESPAPLPESGPAEIANLNRRFNRMLANLRQLEQDRALLLAGVSHDLRTPLARLRLGIEMGVHEDAIRRGMTDDVEEMDRVIGQFLDFARNEHELVHEQQDPNALIASAVERYERAGKSVRFEPGAVPRIPLRPTAFLRLLGNLVDNAFAYGAPPVEVATRPMAGRFVLDVSDRGPGVAPEEVERLKQPFTRASAARSDAAGAAGAGLGLAIVERIARLHGGTFTLLPRPGGGTIAHVELPDGTDVPIPAPTATRPAPASRGTP